MYLIRFTADSGSLTHPVNKIKAGSYYKFCFKRGILGKAPKYMHKATITTDRNLAGEAFTYLTGKGFETEIVHFGETL